MPPPTRVVRSTTTPARGTCAALVVAATPLGDDNPGPPFPSTTPAESPDDSVTVAVASRRLGCDPTTVRALLRCRELRGHRVGKGKDPKGVRVHLASIHDYVARHSVAGEPVNDRAEVEPSPRRRQRSAVHDAAMAELRAMGIAVRHTP